MINSEENLFDNLDEFELSLIRNAVTQLLKDFDYINSVFLKSTLKRPTFTFFNNKQEWGFWVKEPTRQIGLNQNLFYEHPWEEVLIVLRHEMAHQYVDEVLGGDSTPHGQKFKQVCEMLNIPSHASCRFEFKTAIISEDSNVLRKVKKMISLASSSNENEAKIAMAMANNLLLKHNITLAEALNKENTYTYKQIGEILIRIQIEYKMISSILAEFFFVSSIWVNTYKFLKEKNGYILQICGLPENVDIAEYIYHYLLEQIEIFWNKYKKQNKLSQRHRKSYIFGLLTGFKEKLKQERAECKERGLVWLGDPELKVFAYKLNPSTRSVGSKILNYNKNTAADGFEHSKSLNLHMGISKRSDIGGYLN